MTGRPNKGKSSLVATLAQDDRVAIAPLAGTTRHCERHTVRVGDAGYSLVDTPGLQRPAREHR